MIIVDANILLFAYNSSSEFHGVAKSWLQHALSSQEPVRLPWMTIHAFIRTVTNIRAYPKPMGPAEAGNVVASWFSRSHVDIINPGDRYWQIFSGLLQDFQVRGPLVMDAHLAALAIEHGALVCTHDQDFSRFPGIEIVDPCRTKKQ